MLGRSLNTHSVRQQIVLCQAVGIHTIMGGSMLKEVAGDILQSKADMVAHGVAPNDGFTNGLALSLRQQWPAMYKDFRHYCQTFTPKTGELWAWAGVGGA